MSSLPMYDMDVKLGKVDERIIKESFLGKLGYQRAEVITGPQFGVDVAVVELPGGMGMALTSDPLSLIPELGMQESAWLSVQLMVNDIATTGFGPMYGQFVLNLPPEMGRDDFNTYWEHLHQYCAQNSISITGGHTGFIPGSDSTIAGGGTLITFAPLSRIRVARHASAGEAILVTKGAAMSSAAILALRFPNYVRQHLGTEIQQEAAGMFYEISVLKEARLAVGETEYGGITAMHDVTEGGLLGAIYELATASGNGARVDVEALPVGAAQSKVCRLFNLDPLYCIGAGSMIMTCPKDKVSGVIARLGAAHISCCQVGVLTDKGLGMQLIKDEQAVSWDYTGVDPYWAAYHTAVEGGLD